MRTMETPDKKICEFKYLFHSETTSYRRAKAHWHLIQLNSHINNINPWPFCSSIIRLHLSYGKKVPWSIYWGLLLATTIYDHDDYLWEFIKCSFILIIWKSLLGLLGHNLHIAKFQRPSFQGAHFHEFGQTYSYETTPTIKIQTIFPFHGSLPSTQDSGNHWSFLCPDIFCLFRGGI